MRPAPRMGSIGLLLSLLATPAPAQAVPGEERCAEAVRIIATAETIPRRAGWAFGHVVRCADGPAAIAARWRAVAGGTRDLPDLRGWNLQILDQRIADAMMEAARAPARPAVLRVAALQDLLRYVEPSLTYVGGGVGNMVHVSTRVGGQPPSADMPRHVYVLSQELSGDPDTTVAQVARSVWQNLTDRFASLVPDPAALVTFEVVCGAKYRVTNRSDIDLSVALVSPNGAERDFRIAARAIREVGARDTGEVRLFLHGGVEVAIARSSTTPCP